MKKLILTNIQAGVRKLGNVKAFYEHIEAAYVDAIAEITKGLVAVSPSYISLRGNVNSGSGSNYIISAGSILKDGEVFSIPAFTGTAGGGQVPVLGLVSTKTQLEYTDGTTQDTLDNRTYAWSFGTTGSGLVDFSGLVTLKTAVNAMLDVNGQIQAIVDSAPGALDTLNELAAALGDDANFASTVVTALAGKADKAQPAWTNLTLINGWDDSGVVPPRYRINDQGKLEIAGAINSTSATSQIFAQIPALFGSGHDMRIPIVNSTDGAYADINIGGGVSLSSIQVATGYATGKNYHINVTLPIDGDF